MLEIHLMGKPRSKGPEGGPGPATIIKGDSTVGFYGEFPGSEIYSGIGLASALGITEGIEQFSTTSWFKFSHNGKVKYMPKLPIRNSCSWEHLLAKGCAFHRDDPASALMSPGIIWTPQDKVLVHPAGYRFDVHLPNTIVGSYANNPNGTIRVGSESYDLLLRCCSNWPGGAASQFLNYPQNQLVSGTATYVWARECYEGQPAWRLCPVGVSTGIGGYGYTYDTRNIIGWRPVLELLP